MVRVWKCSGTLSNLGGGESTCAWRASSTPDSTSPGRRSGRSGDRCSGPGGTVDTLLEADGPPENTP